GDTPKNARDLGVLNSFSVKEFLGLGSFTFMNDDEDFYRFTLGSPGPFTFTARLTNLNTDANLQLFRDDPPEDLRAPNPREQLISSTNLGTANESITTTLDTPGTYYLRVVRAGTGSTNYLLNLSATSTDTAGSELITARNLGVLTTTTLSAADFVGQIDTTDFFQFSVAS